jgi:hypothetical protein
MEETEGSESSEFPSECPPPADEPGRFSLRRLRKALAKHRAAEEAMADSARESGEVERVGNNLELPDGTWVYEQHPRL